MDMSKRSNDGRATAEVAAAVVGLSAAVLTAGAGVGWALCGATSGDSAQDGMVAQYSSEDYCHEEDSSLMLCGSSTDDVEALGWKAWLGVGRSSSSSSGSNGTNTPKLARTRQLSSSLDRIETLPDEGVGAQQTIRASRESVKGPKDTRRGFSLRRGMTLNFGSGRSGGSNDETMIRRLRSSIRVPRRTSSSAGATGGQSTVGKRMASLRRSVRGLSLKKSDRTARRGSGIEEHPSPGPSGGMVHTTRRDVGTGLTTIRRRKSSGGEAGFEEAPPTVVSVNQKRQDSPTLVSVKQKPQAPPRPAHLPRPSNLPPVPPTEAVADGQAPPRNASAPVEESVADSGCSAAAGSRRSSTSSFLEELLQVQTKSPFGCTDV